MDKIMVTILLTVAGVVCSIVILNAVYPVITGSSSAIVDAATKVDDRIRSNVKIIEISHNSTAVYAWIKNVGASRILGTNSSDVFFGPQTSFTRISYGTMTNPYWEYSLENDSNWVPTATLKVTIHVDSLAAGTYFFKFITPNGISDEIYYSVP
jgi:hypothetical protein